MALPLFGQSLSRNETSDCLYTLGCHCLWLPVYRGKCHRHCHQCQLFPFACVSVRVPGPGPWTLIRASRELTKYVLYEWQSGQDLTSLPLVTPHDPCGTMTPCDLWGTVSTLVFESSVDYTPMFGRHLFWTLRC